MIPSPRDVEAPVGVLVEELAHHLGEPAVVALACDLLGGAEPSAYARELVYLTGFEPDLARWAPYWPKVWGARALLYAWQETASGAVLAGLADPAWRVAEMCLKVSVKRDVPGAADEAVGLSRHELARVRGHAVRLLGATGDTEHVDVVRERLTDDDEGVRRHAGRALDRLELRLDLA